MTRALTLILALSLVGCGALGMTTTAMSPEQLKEFAKIKDAGCSKITGVYMGATFSAITVSIDKGVPPGAGSVKIDDNCGTTLIADPKAPPAVKPAP